MSYLVTVTFLWAFSFSFIGVYLSGQVDSTFAVFIRIFFASLVFLPFTKFKNIPNGLRLKIMCIGAVQIGIMYLFYYNSFLYLSVPEILLFTIFTPFYVTLIYDILHKRFTYLYLISAAIAVLGAYIIRYDNINEGFLFGFLLVQGSNICFALGQSAYKYVLESHKDINQKEIFGYFHFGALIVGTIALLLFGDFSKMSPNLTQWGVLIWLGFIASGAGYFMWNKGATLVDSGVLGIMNNALIPAGLIVNLLFWGKETDFTKLIIGSFIIVFALLLHTYFIKIQKRKLEKS